MSHVQKKIKMIQQAGNKENQDFDFFTYRE